MSRSRLVLWTGVAAGAAANYWLLEGLLADRTDAAGGWISDLGARSESTGWIFDVLDAASGVLLLAFAVVVFPVLGRRGRLLHHGAVALVVAALCSVLDGAFPLSCAESLPGDCTLSYDWIDVIHIAETFVAIAATVASFFLLALGFASDGDGRLRGLGGLTVFAGVGWVACNLVMAASYVVADLEGVRGAFHRGSQVLLGIWLIAAAVVISRAVRDWEGGGAVPSPGLGRIDGDGEAAEQVRMS